MGGTVTSEFLHKFIVTDVTDDIKSLLDLLISGEIVCASDDFTLTCKFVDELLLPFCEPTTKDGKRAYKITCKQLEQVLATLLKKHIIYSLFRGLFEQEVYRYTARLLNGRATVYEQPDTLPRDIYRIRCIITADDGKLVFATNRSTLEGITFWLPPHQQLPSDCYVVSKDNYLAFYVGAEPEECYKVLYVANKTGKLIVTADDIKRHYDVAVGNGIVTCNGLRLGVYGKRRFNVVERIVYLPYEILHRACVTMFLVSATKKPSNFTGSYAIRCAIRHADMLSGETVWLGKFSVSIGSVVRCGNICLKVHVNDIPIYVCDLYEALVEARNFATVEEYNQYLARISKEPLFLRKLPAEIVFNVRVGDTVTRVAIPVKKAEQASDSYIFPLDDLACLYMLSLLFGGERAVPLRVIATTLAGLPNLQSIEPVKIILQQYELIKHRSEKLLDDLLKAYPHRLKKASLAGMTGIIVKGKLHTYFVSIKTAKAYTIVNQKPLLLLPVCIVEAYDKHKALPVADRVVARIIALLNDDITGVVRV